MGTCISLLFRTTLFYSGVRPSWASSSSSSSGEDDDEEETGTRQDKDQGETVQDVARGLAGLQQRDNVKDAGAGLVAQPASQTSEGEQLGQARGSATR